MEQTPDVQTFRRAVGHFATGVTIITARHGEVIHGMTANAVTSLSLDPLLMLVCVDRRAKMQAVLAGAGFFAVNILSDAQEALSRHFSGRGHGETPELAFRDELGVPVLGGALAALVCRVEESLPGGDHLIYTGRVLSCLLGPEGARPLLFYKGRYHHLRVPDPAAHLAPETWSSDSVAVGHEAWPDPLRRALAGDELLP